MVLLRKDSMGRANSFSVLAEKWLKARKPMTEKKIFNYAVRVESINL